MRSGRWLPLSSTRVGPGGDSLQSVRMFRRNGFQSEKVGVGDLRGDVHAAVPR